MWPALTPLPCAGARTVEILERALRWYLQHYFAGETALTSYFSAIEQDRCLDFSDRDRHSYRAVRQIVEALDYIEDPQVTVKPMDPLAHALKAIARKGYIVHIEPEELWDGYRASAYMIEEIHPSERVSQGIAGYPWPCAELVMVCAIRASATATSAVEALAGELGVEL